MKRNWPQRLPARLRSPSAPDTQPWRGYPYLFSDTGIR